jgi:hypothetical protein
MLNIIPHATVLISKADWSVETGTPFVLTAPTPAFQTY